MRSTTALAVLLAACCTGIGTMAETTTVDGTFSIEINATAGVTKALVGSSAMYHINIANSKGASLFDIYKHIDVKESVGPPADKTTVVIAGRFPGDAKLTVSITGATPPITGAAPSGVDSDKAVAYIQDVTVSDVATPYAICANPLAVSGACDEEFTVARTFTEDSSTMVISEWSPPTCMAAAYNGGCAKEETFQLFEYVAPKSMFITMLKMDTTIPKIRKNGAGDVMHVDSWMVTVDMHEGAASDLEQSMAFPMINPIGGGDEGCRTYEQSESHASTRGYRHTAEYVSNNQFVLATPFKATKDATYTIRVRMTREVTALSCDGGDTFAVGILGRDARTCKQQCELNGFGSDSDCAKGCAAAHPLMLEDANLCANLACCGGICGADDAFGASNKNCKGASTDEAKIGCLYAADTSQSENANWLVGANRKCSSSDLAAMLDHSAETGGDSHGVVFAPALSDSAKDHDAGSAITVSCVGGTQLEGSSCDTYTCDRGTFVGSHDGNFQLCSFQTHCLQGCLASDLPMEDLSEFLTANVAKVTAPASCSIPTDGDCSSVVILPCNPKPHGSLQVDGSMSGSIAYECKRDITKGEFVWERKEGNGLGDGMCTYDAADVTTEPPFTMDPNGDSDIDVAGNIVARTATTTTVSTTTTPTATSTTTTAVVERQTLEFTFSGELSTSAMVMSQRYAFRTKMESLIDEHTGADREDILFVSRASSDGTRRSTDSVEIVHFKESSDFTSAQMADFAAEINMYLQSTTVSVHVDNAGGKSTYSLQSVAASTSMMASNICDLKKVDLLMFTGDACTAAADDADDDEKADEKADETADADTSLSNTEKFGLAILIILIVALVLGIGYMARRMQAQSKSEYEEQAAIPMMELDPFASSQSSGTLHSRTSGRSVHAKRRQSALAASEMYAGNASARSAKVQLNNFGGGESNVDLLRFKGDSNGDLLSSKSIRPDPRQQVQALSGGSGSSANIQRHAHRQTVQQRPPVPTVMRTANLPVSPVARSITDDAALGLEELEPATFGGGVQMSVRARPVSVVAGTAKQAVSLGAFSGSSAADAPIAEEQESTAKQALSLGVVSSSTSSDAAIAETQEVPASQRHVVAGDLYDAEAGVVVTDDFVAVGGKMQLAQGLKQVEKKRASMKQGADVGGAANAEIAARLATAEAAALERKKLQAGGKLLKEGL
jgi:hypothetical protein